MTNDHLKGETMMIHDAHDNERERLAKTDPQLLRWRDAWLADHPHRSVEHWIIACAAVGDDNAQKLAAQFPGLMAEYLNWEEPD
jgi:hypothetical protein